MKSKLLITLIAMCFLAGAEAASAQSPPADQYTESEPTATGNKQSQAGGGNATNLNNSDSGQAEGGSASGSGKSSSGKSDGGSSKSSPNKNKKSGGASDDPGSTKTEPLDLDEEERDAFLTAGAGGGSAGALLAILGGIAVAAIGAAWYGRRRARGASEAAATPAVRSRSQR